MMGLTKYSARATSGSLCQNGSHISSEMVYLITTSLIPQVLTTGGVQAVVYAARLRDEPLRVSSIKDTIPTE